MKILDQGGAQHLIDKIKSNSILYAAGETAIPFNELSKVAESVYEFTINFGVTFDSSPVVLTGARLYITNFRLVTDGMRVVPRTIYNDHVVCRYYDSTPMENLTSYIDPCLFVNWFAIEKGVKSLI